MSAAAQSTNTCSPGSVLSREPADHVLGVQQMRILGEQRAHPLVPGLDPSGPATARRRAPPAHRSRPATAVALRQQAAAPTPPSDRQRRHKLLVVVGVEVAAADHGQRRGAATQSRGAGAGRGASRWWPARPARRSTWRRRQRVLEQIRPGRRASPRIESPWLRYVTIAYHQSSKLAADSAPRVTGTKAQPTISGSRQQSRAPPRAQQVRHRRQPAVEARLLDHHRAPREQARRPPATSRRRAAGR